MENNNSILQFVKDKKDAKLFQEIIKKNDLPYIIKTLSNLEELESSIIATKKNLLIIDYPYENADFLPLIKRYKNNKNLSIVVYSGKIEANEIIAILKTGVKEIIFKDSPEKLIAVIEEEFRPKKEMNKEELEYKLLKYKERYERLKEQAEGYKDISEQLNEVQKKFYVFQELSIYAFTILKAVRNEEGKIIDFIWTYANETSARLLKKSIKELIGSRLLEVLPGNLSSGLYEKYVKVVETGEPHNIELQYNSDGIDGWYRNMTIKMDDGVAITFTDISEEKAIEFENKRLLEEERDIRKKLEETINTVENLKEEYRLMGESVPFGAWKTDANGKVMYLSKSFLKLINMTKEEAYKYGWARNLSKEDRTIILNKWKKCLATGEHWEHEYRIIDTDDKLNYVLSKGLPIKSKTGKIDSWVGVNIDITERRVLDEELKNTNNEIKEILDRVSDSFLSVDKDWVIRYINENGRRTTFYQGQVIGKNFWEVFPGLLDTSLEKNYRKAMNEQIPVSFEYFGIIWPRWYSVSLYPSNNGLTIYSQDITESKKAQDELKAALKEKEILIKEVHHRVKNNLQIISSLLNLQANYIEDEKSVECFKDSQTRIRSMAIVHEQLYHSSHLSSLNFKDYLIDLVSQILTTYRISNLIKINVDVDDVFVNLEAGINLGLIINELVLNSLKHAFVVKKEGQIDIILTKSHELTSIIIRDNGDGLPEGFDFANTDSFGMQLVNALIEQMHGSVEIKNEDGTEFIISIELADK